MGEEDYPRFVATFTPSGVEIEIHRWESINAKDMERAFRALVRERRRLIKEALRDERIRKEKKDDDRGK